MDMSPEEFTSSIPLSSGCQIISCDASGLMAINKKAGRASHPNKVPRASAKPPMIRADYNYEGEYYSWRDSGGGKRRLYLLNRLDSPTSGVVLAAFDPECARAAKEAFKNRLVRKVYCAICVGKVVPKFGTWTDNLAFVKGANCVRAVPSFLPGKKAVANYEVEGFDDNGAGLSLLRLEPITGLTHQLRVQCARRSVPILGDATYGNFSFNKKMKLASKLNRLFLHCAETELELEFLGKKIHFKAEAPLPDSFSSLMRYNANIAKLFMSR